MNAPFHIFQSALDAFRLQRLDCTKMVLRAKKSFTGPLWLRALLALWVGLGIALAPGRVLLEAHTQPSAHSTQHHPERHSPRPASEPDSSQPHHSLRCVLCVVGAGTLPLVVRVLSFGARLRLTFPTRRFPLRERHFRLFRSRAPPRVGIAFKSARLYPIFSRPKERVCDLLFYC